MQEVIITNNKSWLFSSSKRHRRHLKRVVTYCKVSSDSEDQKNSYESQVRHYKEYISKRSDW